MRLTCHQGKKPETRKSIAAAELMHDTIKIELPVVDTGDKPRSTRRGDMTIPPPIPDRVAREPRATIRATVSKLPPHNKEIAMKVVNCTRSESQYPAEQILQPNIES